MIPSGTQKPPVPSSTFSTDGKFGLAVLMETRFDIRRALMSEGKPYAAPELHRPAASVPVSNLGDGGRDAFLKVPIAAVLMRRRPSSSAPITPPGSGA